MKLSDFFVMEEKDTGAHHYFYGDKEEYIEDGEDFSNMEDVPVEKWSAGDIIEITSDLFEDVNLHGRINEPREIWEIISTHTDNQTARDCMFDYMNLMFEKYAY